MNRNHKALELDKILEKLAAHCDCEAAAALARALEPCCSLSSARRLMDDTDAASSLMAQFGAPSFGRFRDICPSLRRAGSGASLSARELLDIAEMLRVIRSLSEWRTRSGGAETPLDDRFGALSPNKYLEDAITSAILSEDEIADSASPELSTIRRKIRAATSRVREQLDKMIRSPAYQKLLQDPVVTLRGGRFVVPVKTEHRGEIPGLVHDTSSSGATVFVEPLPVVEANNEIRVLESREKAEIERILAALSAEAGGFAGAIVEDYEIVVGLNLIFAKARLAYEMKAVKPVLCEDGHIILRRARHPLLDHSTAVPIDVELGGGFDTLVITGPNTGGKTVSLKTIGLLSLMAMCGLMPPSGDGSRISVFSKVLSDIGDEQSIEQSLSTFSAHMTNIVTILGEADGNSLVLLDELGAGTDPVEGAALAAAILERLRSQGARIAATTHYAELKAFAIHSEGVENGSCEFDVSTLRPTYRLLIGVPGRSNAFAISRRLGINEDIISRANELVSSEDRRFEDVVSRLEAQRKQLENDIIQAQAERAQAADAARRAKQETDSLDRARERELEKARKDARRIVERARADAEAMMEELDSLRKEISASDFARRAAEAKSGLRSKLRGMEDTIDPVAGKTDRGYVLPRPLKQGDEVIIMDIDKRGTVITPPDASGHAAVQAGIIKTRVHISNLRLSEEKKNPAKTQSIRTGIQSRAVRSAGTEIDLRGKMTDEGIMELDRFIDEAALTGLEQITVIHGKGTGALRAAVQKFLRGHPSVKSFRLGAYGEGETGVTIAELK